MQSEDAVYAHLYAEEDRLRRAVTRAQSDLVMAEMELRAFLSKHTSQTSLVTQTGPVEANSSIEEA